MKTFILIFLISWLLAYAIYLLFNRGMARNARGLQARRFAASAVVAALPVAVASAGASTALIITAVVSLLWMTAYPVTFHLTNRRVLPEYDNHFDIAFAFYFFALVSALVILASALPQPYSVVAMSLLAVIVVAFAAVPVFIIGYYFVCGGCVDTAGVQVIYDTNYNETLEFLRSYKWYGVAGIAALVLAMAGGTAYFFAVGGVHASAMPWWCYLVQGGVAVFAAIYLFKPVKGVFVRTGLMTLVGAVRDYVCRNAAYHQAAAKRYEALNVRLLGGGHDEPHTIVMVIGESASRDYIKAFTESLPEATSPWLSAMAADTRHCILVPNAYSCGVQTVPCLEKALTEVNQYAGGDFYSACSVVDTARKAGYRVHWYSNQGHLGEADTPITLVAETADTARWTRQQLNKVHYDGALLDFFGEIDKKCNNFVVLHLMGSHFNFESRFPEQERMWGKKGDNDNITNYKNSLRYTDSVLQRVYDYCAQNLNLAAMVYFSDHATVPDRHRLPNFGGFMDIRIPMFVCLSEQYIREHPQRHAALAANRNKVFTNDLVYNLMCGIFDIESEHFDETLCLASEHYSLTKEAAVSMNGKVRIKENL